MTERSADGKFVKGQSGNPAGRAPKQREERYRDILVNTITFDDWAEIIKKAGRQAKQGDAVARKWLSDYLVGPPPQKTDVTLDGNIRIIDETEGKHD